MRIDGNGEVSLPSTQWELCANAFLSFADQVDPAWANSQRLSSPQTPYSAVYGLANNGRFKVRKRGNDYSFSFGVPKSHDGHEPLTMYPDISKSDWTHNGIGCSRVVVNRAKRCEPK